MVSNIVSLLSSLSRELKHSKCKIEVCAPGRPLRGEEKRRKLGFSNNYGWQTNYILFNQNTDPIMWVSVPFYIQSCIGFQN